MTHLRFLALALALASGNIMIACTMAPAMQMGAPAAHSMASHEHMASMQAQMKSMREMHAKMMTAKTADERQALMAEHMKAMQGGMGMMKAMSPEMAQHHKMLMQHVEMMQMMMDMMAQRMPMPAAKP
jgi:microsomal dipeptidase-like Zn-dependent dipeptidase